MANQKDLQAKKEFFSGRERTLKGTRVVLA
jgi:hypothetical protein